MADNFTFKDAAGNTVTGAADDIGGILHQRIKWGFGPDGQYSDASIQNPFPVAPSRNYETVAAGVTQGSPQTMGSTGGAGDFLYGITVIPATTSPGTVTVRDGSGSWITVFTGGTGSVGSLVPFFIALNMFSTGGAWTISTGGNVSLIVQGNFT